MTIPKIILDAQSYRTKVIKDINPDYDKPIEERDEFEEDIIEDGNVSLALDDIGGSVKERTNYALIKLYEQEGYSTFRDTCLQMKQNKWFDKDEFGKFKGEIAEVFLYITILEFIKHHDLPWKVYLSLVVPHRSKIEGQTTEIDVVLVSEEMITVFEAKSYDGDKVIRDICTISRRSGSKDIYSQNALHCQSLIKLIEDYNINDQKGMKSVLFSYASGALKDNRTPAYKKLMPVVDEDSIVSYLTLLKSLTNKYWRPTIYNRMDELSNKLTMEDHMKSINSMKEGDIKWT